MDLNKLFDRRTVRGKNRIVGFAVTLAVCAILAIAGVQLSDTASCRMEDAEGGLLAEISLKNGEYVIDCRDEDWSYVDTAFHEAEQLLAEDRQISENTAGGRLVGDEAVIRTNYQKKIQATLTEAIQNSQEAARYDSAGAVSNTEGQLLASYSQSVSQEERNNVIYPTWAGSTMKPVSVYGPALEEDKICWSSMEEDSPFMQIEDENGEWKDWPENTEVYTYKQKTMAQALKESNNAIAVKTLKKLGPASSLNWLEERFQYTVEGERSLLDENKENEIYDNLALGYLDAGVTVKQMLENYQVFATYGERRRLRAVDHITMGKGDILHARENTQQIFSKETAYIVNRMLKDVVEEGGTGADAVLEGVDLCGKTGTSDDYRDNWFIGLTPEYLCGVWYRCETPETHIKNESVSICRDVLSRLPDQKGMEFVCPETVEQLSYCTKTGLRAGKYCAETKKGYYKKDSFTQICDCQSALAINKKEGGRQ